MTYEESKTLTVGRLLYGVFEPSAEGSEVSFVIGQVVRWRDSGSETIVELEILSRDGKGIDHYQTLHHACLFFSPDKAYEEFCRICYESSQRIKKARGIKNALLISKSPEEFVKIVNREKTLDLRRYPYDGELPIDVYIYCEEGEGFVPCISDKEMARLSSIKVEGKAIEGVNDKEPISIIFANGKIAAKYTLTHITEYRAEFYPDIEDPFGKDASLEQLEKIVFDEEYPNDYEMAYYERVLSNEDSEEELAKIDLLRKTCMTYDQLRKYVGEVEYVEGWEIENPVILDKPMYLNHFGLENASPKRFELGFIIEVEK